MTITAQKSFASGELSPSLYARTDLVKYATGLRTCKNNIVLRYGGTANRPGSSYMTDCKYHDLPARLVPFIFNAAQTYILEFGFQYMRVLKNGIPVREAAQNITAITKATTAVVTITGHGYSNDDEVYLTGVSGMIEVNNRNFVVKGATANTFQLYHKDGTTPLDSSGFGTYTSGGTAAKIYEIATNYLSSEVGDLKYVQSADVITIVHPSHPPAELSRFADDNWTLTDILFAPDVSAPTGISASAGGAGSKTFRYKVTAINEDTYEESLAGRVTATITISGATKTNPVVVTATSHGLANEDEVYITGIVGMTELNGRVFQIDNSTANTFELVGIDGTGYTTYSSGGTAQKTFAEITSAADPTDTAPHTVSWARVAGALEYNIYKRNDSGTYGQIGTSNGTSFADININPNVSYAPPNSKNPFVGTGNYPSTVTYIQQRLALANLENDPERIYLSKTGNFKNFTISSPIQSDDSINFAMAGRQVNSIENMVDLGRLVILTSGGEWSASGNEAGIITPTEINTKQYSYNGSAPLQPIIIDGSAIYQQARGSIIRDLAYNFDIDGYTGNDLTIYSAHLFDNNTLVDWAYQQIPHSILWIARDDGALLGMTYIKNQELIGWHQHDLAGGLVENVAVVPEGNEDTLYVLVSRYIDGQDVRYIERINTRQINDIVDNIFMDCAQTYDGRNTNSSHTMTLSGGSTWDYDEDLTLTSSASYFDADEVGNAIHLELPVYNAKNILIDTLLVRCTIKAYTNATTVTVNPHKVVPASMRSVALSDWSRAVDQVAGLWHLEGEEVSVFGDGFVVASPNNATYETVTVTSGVATLDKPYSVIHVGLPYFSDLETLDIDTVKGETLADKFKNISHVTMFVESTRGVWVGAKPPSDDVTDPLEGLTELKIRNTEDYDSPVSLKTDTVEVTIQPEWNSNGRVFIRQVDPIPMTILSINPAGFIPFTN